jgi:hypothetical protein
MTASSSGTEAIMALWRNIGGLAFIAPGATHLWEIVYPPNGRDVGTVVAAPNLQEGELGVELIALDQGVVERDGGEAVAIHYTVRIHNNGTAPVSMAYNLNIGDWQ